MSEIATRTPTEALVAQVRTEGFLEQIKAALPGNVTPARFVRVTVTALRENPDLAGAEQASLFSAVVRCAQDGLLPDSREAALVIFGGKAVYMPMIGGFRKIAAEFGWSLRTRVVYENDTFEHTLGLDETLVHNPARPGLQRGPLVAAYAIATHRDGRREIEVIYAEDVAKIRKASRSANRGPWVEWEDRMWEKSAGRRLFAKLPLGERDRARIASVIEADELAPGEAVALLYGREISVPDTQPDHSSTEENGTRQGAEEVVKEAEQEPSSSSETDGPSAPADAAEPVEIEIEGEAKLVEETQFSAPEGVGSSDDVLAADTAADNAFPKGKHKGMTLREVADLGDEGATYIRYVLQSWDAADPFVPAAWAFCRVYLPEVVEFVEAKKGESA